MWTHALQRDRTAVLCVRKLCVGKVQKATFRYAIQEIHVLGDRASGIANLLRASFRAPIVRRPVIANKGRFDLGS